MLRSLSCFIGAFFYSPLPGHIWNGAFLYPPLLHSKGVFDTAGRLSSGLLWMMMMMMMMRMCYSSRKVGSPTMANGEYNMNVDQHTSECASSLGFIDWPGCGDAGRSKYQVSAISSFLLQDIPGPKPSQYTPFRDSGGVQTHPVTWFWGTYSRIHRIFFASGGGPARGLHKRNRCRTTIINSYIAGVL